MNHRLTFGVAGIAIIAVAVVYWPVIHAGFVWDDIPDFVEMGWLTHGDAWKHYIFKDFNNWSNYFRPLVVALLTLQVRLFNVTPGPMHAVSLAVHMVNMLMVGLLSWRCSEAMPGNRRVGLLAISMMLFGLHPILIESVAWISCQFDLVATLFMLLGLLANTCIKRASGRAIAVAACFFLAACAKESAAAFPLTLAVFEWARQPWKPQDGLLSRVRIFIARNWQAYVAVLVAGIAYLAFRHWALGQLVGGGSDGTLTAFSRLQEVSFTYLHYWAMLFWPMHGMNPVHAIDSQQFLVLSFPSLLIDVTAVGTVTMGLYFALKRSSPIGCMVLMMTAGLVPVLHIVPMAFAPSLYHERYLMMSLAGMCAMLPLIHLPIRMKQNQRSLIRALAGIVGCAWLVLAVIGIRATLPLWSNSVSLWRWAVSGNSDSIDAKDNLLTAYIEDKDYASGNKLIDQLRADHVSCTNCMLNAAILAVAENDPTRAAAALQEVKQSKEIVTDQQMFHMYMLTTGQMLVLQGQLQDAEAVLRAAIKSTPLDPQAQFSLAVALARQGKENEAREVGKSGIALLSPGQQGPARKTLDHAIETGIQSYQRMNPSATNQ